MAKQPHLRDETLGRVNRVRPDQAQQRKYLPGRVRYDRKRHFALLQLLREERGDTSRGC